MRKPDTSIHHVAITSIIRSTMKPYEFKWATIYASTSEYNKEDFSMELSKGELAICSTKIDDDNYLKRNR